MVDYSLVDERDIERHFDDLSLIELLGFLEELSVTWDDEVDGDTLSTETSRTSNSVNVGLLADGEIVVDDQVNLVDIDTTGEHVGGDEHSGSTRSERSHDEVTFGLLHFTVHGGDGHVLFSKSGFKFFDSLLGVAVDNSLGNFDVVVKLNEGIELPFFSVEGNVELLNTVEGKIVVLDQDDSGVSHELLGDFKNFRSHGSGEQSDLDVVGELLEDLVDLVLETSSEHLISLVEDEELKLVGDQETLLNHLEDSSGSSDDDLDTVTEFLLVFLGIGTTSACIDGNLQVFSQELEDTNNLLSQFSDWSDDEYLSLG